jgi:O-antigen ligase
MTSFFKYNSNQFSYFIFAISCLLMIAFFVAPAIMSITVIALLAIGAFFIHDVIRFFMDKKTLAIMIGSLVLLQLLHLYSVTYSVNQAEAWRKLLLKAPFFLSFLLWPLFTKMKLSHKLGLLIVFNYAVFFTGSVSSMVYLLNRSYFDPLILQAKPIPISFGYGIYHIQFSLLNAIAGISGLLLLFFYKKNITHYLFVLLLIITIGNIVNLHILSARTGIMGFYLAVLALGIFVGIKKGKILKWLFFILLCIVILPTFAYFISGSFRNRIANSKEDMETIIASKNPNDKSVAMRVEAWKTSISLIKKNVITGVGLGDLETNLQEEYVINQTLLSPYNRKNPHNQFLETGIHTGVLGMLLLFTFVITYLISSKNNPMMLCVSVIIFSAMFFESMLERQVSINAMSFFLGFFMFLDDGIKK